MSHCQHCAFSKLFTNRSLNQLIRSKTNHRISLTITYILHPLTHYQHWQSLHQSPGSCSSSRWLLPNTPTAFDQHLDLIHFHSPMNADHSTTLHSPVSSVAPTQIILSTLYSLLFTDLFECIPNLSIRIVTKLIEITSHCSSEKNRILWNDGDATTNIIKSNS
jgi:hypothetical protein